MSLISDLKEVIDLCIELLSENLNPAQVRLIRSNLKIASKLAETSTIATPAIQVKPKKGSKTAHPPTVTPPSKDGSTAPKSANAVKPKAAPKDAPKAKDIPKAKDAPKATPKVFGPSKTTENFRARTVLIARLSHDADLPSLDKAEADKTFTTCLLNAADVENHPISVKRIGAAHKTLPRLLAIECATIADARQVLQWYHDNKAAETLPKDVADKSIFRSLSHDEVNRRRAARAALANQSIISINTTQPTQGPLPAAETPSAAEPSPDADEDAEMPPVDDNVSAPKSPVNSWTTVANKKGKKTITSYKFRV